MKNIIFALPFLLFAFSAQAQASTDTTLIVNGVCNMCKSTIEKAAKLEGVSSAEWDLESLTLRVKFDPKLVDLKAINASIVKSGYDTEFETASDTAYYKLDPCCYYRDPNNFHKKK